VHEDPFLLKLLARYLEGYRIVGLPNEGEVATLASELFPRAIITTPELAERVYQRLLGLDIDVPVVACSMPRLRQQTQIEGALTYLLKPVTRDMIEATLAQVQSEGEMTVLIADDDRDTVRLIEALLRSLARPCRVLKAYDGYEALAVMQDEVPDLVLLDLLMPGLDGEATLREMRSTPRLAAVPVAIISARDSTEGGAVTLGTWISVRSQRALDAAQGIRRLQAILDVLTPTYVSDAASVLSPPIGAAR
jgi:CheY-like chemotaxis protein